MISCLLAAVASLWSRRGWPGHVWGFQLGFMCETGKQVRMYFLSCIGASLPFLGVIYNVRLLNTETMEPVATRRPPYLVFVCAERLLASVLMLRVLSLARRRSSADSRALCYMLYTGAFSHDGDLCPRNHRICDRPSCINAILDAVPLPER